jgi:hypothetical protein
MHSYIRKFSIQGSSGFCRHAVAPGVLECVWGGLNSSEGRFARDAVREGYVDSEHEEENVSEEGGRNLLVRRLLGLYGRAPEMVIGFQQLREVVLDLMRLPQLMGEPDVTSKGEDLDIVGVIVSAAANAHTLANTQTHTRTHTYTAVRIWLCDTEECGGRDAWRWLADHGSAVDREGTGCDSGPGRAFGCAVSV